MSPQFQFFGFTPEEPLRASANHTLERLLGLCPDGSMAVALLERNGDGYRCAVDLYTRFGPMVAQSQQQSADAALRRACEALFAKLY